MGGNSAVKEEEEGEVEQLLTERVGADDRPPPGHPLSDAPSWSARRAEDGPQDCRGHWGEGVVRRCGKVLEGIASCPLRSRDRLNFVDVR